MGNTSVTRYDEKGRVVEILAPGETEGAGRRTVYDSNGWPIQSISPSGLIIETTYDERGRIQASKDPAGNVTRYEYGEDGTTQAGQLIATQYPTYKETYQYDQQGRQTTVTQHLGNNETRTQSQAYDALGQRVASTDPAGRATLTQYDAMGRNIQSTDPAGQSTKQGWNAHDQFISLTDANGNTHKFEYDKVGHPIKEIRPQGGTIKYAYNALGNLISRTDAGGNIRTYIYDSASLKVKEVIKFSDDRIDQKIDYFYDADGHLIKYEQNDRSGTLISGASYKIDIQGRVIESLIRYGKIDGFAEINLTIGQSFNVDGQLKSNLYSDGSSQRYKYINGYLSEVILPNESIIKYDDYQWMMPGSISAPGVVKRIIYDNLQQSIGFEIKNHNNKTLAKQFLQYDLMGNVVQTKSEIGQTDYYYDRMNRIVGIEPDDSLKNLGLPKENYDYDPLGNRIGSRHQLGVWSYNADNQLTRYPRSIPFGTVSVLDTEVSYIPQGHVQKEVNGQEKREYEYNAAERVIRFVKTLNNQTSPEVESSYKYDPFGRRIAKNIKNNKGETTTWFVYTENALVAEVNENGQITKAYGFNPQTGQQGLWSTDPLWQASVIDSSLSNINSQYHYLHTDHLGTPILATSIDGDVSWKAISEAFGATNILPESSILVNFRFPGQYYDNETDTSYNFHRDYNFNYGRYIQADPIGLRAGVSLYAYANSNPLNIIDSHGLQSFDRFNKCSKFRWGDYYNRVGGASSDVVGLNSIGLLDEFIKTPSVSSAMESTFSFYKNRLRQVLEGKCGSAQNYACLSDNKIVSETISVQEFDGDYAVADDGDCMEPIGRGKLYNKGTCSGSLTCNTGEYHGTCSLRFYIRDAYKNPWDYYSLAEKVGVNFNTGTPYKIHADWFKSKSW
ncbi:RHS repeat-associated core domain-containing protein [Comamonas odontotermitis]